MRKRPAKAERLHSSQICRYSQSASLLAHEKWTVIHSPLFILLETFSVKLPLPHLTSPSPFWRSPVLPPALAHPWHPPAPDGYRCSALLRYHYAPSDTGASLDSYLTSPYCCNMCGGRHVDVSSIGQKNFIFFC